MKTLFMMLVLLLAAIQPVFAQDEELIPFSNDTFGIQGLAPADWAEVSAGVFVRGNNATDPTLLAQQAVAGASLQDIVNALLPQMGVRSLPESTEDYTTDFLTWTIYYIEVEVPGRGIAKQDLALAEQGGTVYLIWMVAVEDEYDALHESVFLPVLEAYTLLDMGDVDAVAIAHAFAEALTAQDYETTLSMFDEEMTELFPDGLEETNEGILQQTGAFIALREVRDNPTPGVVVIPAEFENGLFELTISVDTEGKISGVFIRPSTDDLDQATGTAQAITEDMLAELEAYINEAYQRYGIPGTSVAIVQGSEVIYANGFGVKAIGGDDPVTPETLFAIASVSKPINATYLATLVDADIIRWDTPITEILPEFELSDPELTQQATIRDLIANNYGLLRNDFAWVSTDSTLDDLITALAEQPFAYEPGQAFGYQNALVTMAGFAGTVASGGSLETAPQDYAADVQTRLFEPTGMATATLDFEAAVNSENLAAGHGVYATTNELYIGEYYNTDIIAPAGGVFASALDMAAFLSLQLNEGATPDGTQVVSAENLQTTWQPQVTLSDFNIEKSLFPLSAEVSYGLGWFIEDFRGVEIISHAGNLDYTTSVIAFIPDANVGITILHNRIGTTQFNMSVVYRLAEMLYGLDYEADAIFETQRASSESYLAEDLPAQLDPVIDPEAVADYIGEYSNNVQIEMRNNTELWMVMGEREIQLVTLETGGYMGNNGLLYTTQIDFQENETGGISIIAGGALELARSQ